MSANTNSNRPAFEAFVITERTGKKNIWTKIGAMWANKDGKGFTCQLHANPIDGKITFREPLPEREVDEANPAEQSVAEDTDF